jgi:hypothetical protein
MKLEFFSIIQKDSKQKIAIKRMRIQIEIQNKFYIWLKGEIEKKNNFNKKKEWGTNW